MNSTEPSYSISATAASPSTTPTSGVSPPKRFIFTMVDMNHFIDSPVKRELLSFVTNLGRSTMQSSQSCAPYDASNPLIGLSPGMASLHGSLSEIASTWLKELPPDEKAKARFGNPTFKEWHARLVNRSRGIIESIMDCHVEYVVQKHKNVEGDKQITWDMDVLTKCSEAGQQAASQDDNNDKNKDGNEQQEKVIVELQAYLHQAFGHEIRLDYGTGHECSFYIFLYALCKIGIFGNIPKTTTPSNDIMAPVALSITSQYLQVCKYYKSIKVVM